MSAPSRWSRRYGQEAAAETRRKKQAAAGKRKVAAHKRVSAGHVVHVSAYYRRPAAREKRGSSGMPF